MQRRSRLVPLLRQQVQLLADDDRRPTAVPASAAGHAQGRQPPLAHRPMPGLHEAAAVRRLRLISADDCQLQHRPRRRLRSSLFRDQGNPIPRTWEGSTSEILGT